MSSPPTPIKLPPSLDLPPHLSAHKYLMVCTLTVAAWDTLVLIPRTWRLFRKKEWPVLKILFHFMGIFMPVEFTIVAVAFFDTRWTQEMCQSFYLFEPICTAVLMACASIVHVIRIHAIYENNRLVLGGMTALFAIQVVVTAICCGFYRSVPLLEGQGCIAGPKHNWVGIYWLSCTLTYTASLGLALYKSVQSNMDKKLTPWKLMLRDGINLYGAIWLVNAVNMLFWFIMTPTGPEDPVKTIVTSMAAVLTTSMTLRIILNVRGSLAHGGTFANSAHSNSVSNSSGSRTTHVHSGTGPGQVPNHTFTLDQIRSKPGNTPGHPADWSDADTKQGAADGASSVGININVVDATDGHSENRIKERVSVVAGEDDYEPFPPSK